MVILETKTDFPVKTCFRGLKATIYLLQRRESANKFAGITVLLPQGGAGGGGGGGGGEEFGSESDSGDFDDYHDALFLICCREMCTLVVIFPRFLIFF